MEVQVSTEMLLAPSLFMGKALPKYQEPDLNTHTLWPCPRGPPALAQSPSLALANRTAIPEWNTSKHHSVQRGEAVTDTLRHELSPFPKL